MSHIATALFETRTVLRHLHSRKFPIHKQLKNLCNNYTRKKHSHYGITALYTPPMTVIPLDHKFTTHLIKVESLGNLAMKKFDVQPFLTQSTSVTDRQMDRIAVAV